MVRRALVVLCVGFMCIFVASCGQTFELQSLTVSPTSPNLEGIGATQALTVTAHFSNSKTQDVTRISSYQLGASADGSAVTGTGLAPLTAVNLSTSGILQAVGASCTWHASPTDSPANTKFDYTTNPYPVTITYSNNGVTATAHSFVSVASAGACYDGQAFLAPSGFGGN
jgi:hypothetical protein